MASSARERFSASSMVSPVTNCSPIIRIAMSTPRRITGSPARAIRRVSAADRLRSLTVAVSLPVTTRPQVAALTNSDRPPPRCERQSPSAILSRISASRVAVSGMRSSASARHISATPSWLDSEYSCTSPSTPEPLCLARSAVISLRAVFLRGRANLFGQRGGFDQRRQAFGFRPAIGGRDRLAQRRLRAIGGAKSAKGRGAVVAVVFCGWLIDMRPSSILAWRTAAPSNHGRKNRIGTAAYPSGKFQAIGRDFLQTRSTSKSRIIRYSCRPGRTIGSQSRTVCDSLWRAIRHSSSPGMQVRQTIGRTA